jgi:hypothetical protein
MRSISWLVCRLVLTLAAARLDPLPDGRLVERLPASCPRGHRLRRNEVLVGWLPCDCTPRRRGPAGHRTYLCRAPTPTGPCGAELRRPPCRRIPDP